MDAVVQTVRSAVRGDAGADATRLNPGFRYLRVTVEGRVVFLALGNVDSHAQGPVEVWYSARKEVLRIQNGRVIGAVGLPTEWRDVSLPELPAWSAMAGSGKSYQWVRKRDVMPGYRFGVRDALVLRVVAPPTRSALQGLDPKSLTWFEERFQAESPGGTLTKLVGMSEERTLPPARYAVDLRDGVEIVVYGEQCLAPELCFTWQRWAAVPENK